MGVNSMGMTKSARAARRALVEGLLAERAREGLTLSALARRSGIPVGTLAGWAWRLRKSKRVGASGVKSAGFVELVAQSAARPSQPGARYEIVVRGGRRLLVEGAIDESELLRLIRVLEAC